MARLSNSTLSQAKAFCPTYDREAVDIGIVHLGPGAFHRSHQAVFTDQAMAKSGGNWGICAVSLNSRTASDALSPQDGLYTLAIKDKLPTYRVIGSIKEVLCARDDGGLVSTRLASAAVSIVTLTITEKGYALGGNGHLDLDNPSIALDLKSPDTPSSAIGYLVKACRERREQGTPPLTLISCDNLPGNGDKLRTACTEFAAQIDESLSTYIAENILFPNTMVDSITPATDGEVIETVANAIGLEDAGPVQREAFAQWVIEDKLPKRRPDWEGAGVIVTNDVHGFEKTKLRILNGAHITLTYLGLLMNIESVEDAINTPALRNFVDSMMTDETIPTIDPPQGLSLTKYWAQTTDRFENPNIRHLLEQISHDGSQKIPARIFPVVEFHAGHDLIAQKACFVIAAWIEFNRQRRASGNPPTDAYLAQNENRLPDSALSASDYACAFLGTEAFVPRSISGNSDLAETIITAAQKIADSGVKAAIAEYM